MVLPIYTSAAFTGQNGVELAANASVEVRSEADDSLVTLYSDREGNTQINNPFQADEFGRFEFFADPVSEGWRIAVTSGDDTHTLRYQQPMGSLAGVQGSTFTMSLLDEEDAAAWLTALGLQAVAAFLAHKNDVAQTDIASGAYTKVTFDSEDFDVGGHYDAANSRLQPTVAGKWRLTAALFFGGTNAADEEQLITAIYKNGVLHRQAATRRSGTGGESVTVSCIVDADGSTDYFEVYALASGSGDHDVIGLTTLTFFCGERV